MSEVPVSEKPSQVEVPQQNSFERMQRFLQQYGLKGRSEIAAGGIIGDFLVYLQFSFTKPPLVIHTNLLATQRDVSSVVPPDIVIELFEVKTKKEQNKEIMGERLVMITLRNPPPVRKERAFIYISPLLFPRTLVGLATRAFGLSPRLWKKSDYEYVTESEDEVSKIVDTIILHHTKTQSAEELGVNRRSFLKRVAAEAVIGAAAGIIVDKALGLLGQEPVTPSPESIDPLSSMNSEELKKFIEKNFPVEILPATFIPDFSTQINNEPAKIPTVDWEEEDLRRLARSLRELPAHFYEPREVNGEKKKLRIGISKETGQCFCKGDPEFYERHPAFTILLKKDLHKTASHFDDQELQGREPALFQVAHEFVHSVTTPEIDKYTRLIIEPLEVGEEGFLGHFSSELKWPAGYKLSSELSSPTVIPSFLDVPRAYHERPDDYVVIDSNFIVSKSDYFTLGANYFKKQLAEHGERFRYRQWLFAISVNLSSKSRLGYGATSAHEFLSVAAEVYVRGEEYFIKTYEPFLGIERVRKLYEGMRWEIFRGREY